MYSGRDGIGTTMSCVPSRPEEKFCPVPKIFGTEISRPKLPRDGTGRKNLNTPICGHPCVGNQMK